MARWARLDKFPGASIVRLNRKSGRTCGMMRDGKLCQRKGAYDIEGGIYCRKCAS